MTYLNDSICPFFDDVHTERCETPGDFFHAYEFSIPADNASSELVHEKANVVVTDLDGNVRLFTIKDIEVDTSSDGSVKRVYAEDAAQEELLCKIVEPTLFENHSCKDLLEHFLAGSQWNVGTVEALTADERDIEYTAFETAWECILDIAQRWGLYVVTRVEVGANEVTGRYVDLVKYRGTYTGKFVRYGGDTESIVRRGNGGELYTAAYGAGMGATTFASVEWTVVGGDPVDKPLGQAWVGDDVARMGDGSYEHPGYGIAMTDGTVIHRFGVYRDDSLDGEIANDAGLLLQKTWEWLQEHNKPRYEYDVAVVALERIPAQQPGDSNRYWERIRIGDTVIVRDTKSYPHYSDEARVTEVRRSYTDPTQDTFTMGIPTKRLSDYLRDMVRLQRKPS